MITLSTTTGITNGHCTNMQQTLEVLSRAGFAYLDMDLWGQGKRGMPLSYDDWRLWASTQRALADANGIKFRQTHGQTLSGMQWDDPAAREEADYTWEINYRAIEATRILGARWMVMHPCNLPHDPLYSRKKALEANLTYLSPFIEVAKRAGIGIAVENMVDFRGNRRRYCGGDPEELIELVDRIHDPDVGICIDTGHANLSGIDVGEFIRMAGDRLKCTHINDNLRDGDTHLAPFFGNINWQDTVQALRDIGYTGDFSFEIGSQRIPPAARQNWYRYVMLLGLDLLNL